MGNQVFRSMIATPEEVHSLVQELLPNLKVNLQDHQITIDGFLILVNVTTDKIFVFRNPIFPGKVFESIFEVQEWFIDNFGIP